MSQKSEIKVYLPLHLIGELESLKRAGNRSHFVEKAIREKLKNQQGCYMDDFAILALLCHVRDRLITKHPNEVLPSMIQVIIDEVMA